MRILLAFAIGLILTGQIFGRIGGAATQAPWCYSRSAFNGLPGGQGSANPPKIPLSEYFPRAQGWIVMGKPEKECRLLKMIVKIHFNADSDYSRKISFDEYE